MVKTAGKGLANKPDRTPEEDDMLDMMVNGGKRVSLQNLKTVTEWYKSAFQKEEKQMKLYFENMVTTVTTLMIVSLVGFVGYSISNRGDINFWGKRDAVSRRY